MFDRGKGQRILMDWFSKFSKNKVRLYLVDDNIHQNVIKNI